MYYLYIILQVTINFTKAVKMSWIVFVYTSRKWFCATVKLQNNRAKSPGQTTSTYSAQHTRTLWGLGRKLQSRLQHLLEIFYQHNYRNESYHTFSQACQKDACRLDPNLSMCCRLWAAVIKLGTASPIQQDCLS